MNYTLDQILNSIGEEFKSSLRCDFKDYDEVCRVYSEAVVKVLAKYLEKSNANE